MNPKLGLENFDDKRRKRIYSVFFLIEYGFNLEKLLLLLQQSKYSLTAVFVIETVI